MINQKKHISMSGSIYLLNLNYIPYDTPILSYDLPEYNIVFIPQNHEMYHMDETEQCLNGN